MTGSIKLAGKLTRPTTKSNKMTYEFSIRPQSKWKMHVTNFITLDSCGFLSCAAAPRRDTVRPDCGGGDRPNTLPDGN
jgi:hypothetical protein